MKQERRGGEKRKDEIGAVVGSALQGLTDDEEDVRLGGAWGGEKT